MSFGAPKSCSFCVKKDGLEEPEECGTILIWPSNDAKDMLIGLWSKETVQFALENIKTSKETREVYSTLQVSNTFYLIQFDQERWHFVSIKHVTFT